MRVIGPNSFGVINTDDDIRLNASLAPTLPAPGGLALFSQSGALGVQVLASATSRGIGVSTFVSAGNRADVSGNDLLQYWLDDQRTSAVGLYLESVGNPRKFSRVARRLARRKPVIVVKSGVSSYGVPPGHEVRARPDKNPHRIRPRDEIVRAAIQRTFDEIILKLPCHQHDMHEWISGHPSAAHRQDKIAKTRRILADVGDE